MGLLEIILISVGLAMDATAISMTNGMCMKNIRHRHALIIGATFGVFQGIMPIIGYFAGAVFANKISAIDHWIALILLGFIGGKMIYEALKHGPEAVPLRNLSLRLLLVQAIATSIDALAVGVSFAAFTVPIWFASAVIALVTFLFSFVAFYIGKKFGDVLNQKAELIGGIILIFIGVKIFLEHMI